MEQAIPLIIVLVLGIPIVLAIWLVVRAVSARRRIEELSRRVDDLQMQVVRLQPSPLPATAAKTAEESPRHFTPATLPPLRPDEIKPVEPAVPPAAKPAPIPPPPLAAPILPAE